MPIYEYYCDENAQSVEVMHSMHEKLTTWGELCRQAEIDLGDTPSGSAVRRLVSAPGLAFPKTNSELKNLGFTKLVRREKGVYENVTASGGDARYMNADDPSSVPNLKKKIRD